MDNDSAHHATIALHMFLTGDYASLIDQGGDYLDKPHLHFWLSAMSYKIFGVNSFAYKFPSFLFTILGTYSTYRLGKALYHQEIGKLAALLIASAFAYILANSDVRMDAILTASIALATWQLIAFIQNQKFVHAFVSGLALALGFSTKGPIAVFIPLCAAFCYILYRKDWTLFINWKWIWVVIFFGIFISPVLYCYYLQYNLHPEKIVRNRDHINGVKFILLNQSVERFSGGMGSDAKNDYLFFLHSFLWAFAPWSILTYIAVAGRIKNFLQRREEWATTGTFILVLLVVSFSGFKLPHYLNIVFPVASVITSVFIIGKNSQPRWIRTILIIQLTISILLLLLNVVISAWAFPVSQFWPVAVTVLLLALLFYFFKSPSYTRLQKAVMISVQAMILTFFLLNSSFYPQLLKYQAGQNLAKETKGKVDPQDVYERPHSYSASYNFYTRSLYKPFSDSLLHSGKKVWLLTEPGPLNEFQQEGYSIGRIYSVPHYRVSKLGLKFFNPSTRAQESSTMMLVEVTGKK